MNDLLNALTAWVATHPKVAIALSSLVAALVAAITQEATDWLGEITAPVD